MRVGGRVVDGGDSWGRGVCNGLGVMMEGGGDGRGAGCIAEGVCVHGRRECAVTDRGGR